MIKRSLSLGALALVLSAPLAATQYELIDGAPPVYGADQYVKAAYEDTLLDIARRYSVGYEEIRRANPTLDLWIPGAGADVLVPGRRILPPGPREGIVVNLPEHRLYYYPRPKKHEKPVVITFPVSVGKMDWRTPMGQTQIINKITLPYWHPPPSVLKEHAENGDPLPKVVPPGRDNPLGDYAMRLAIHPGDYLIHGTNNPQAVGMAVTHGCIRLYPEDIEALFKMVPVGTKVWLINEPVKVAFVDGELLLEAHPQIDAQGQPMEPDLDLLSLQLDHALGSTTAAINWDLARETLQAAIGMPTLVGLQADLDAPAGSIPATPARSSDDAAAAPAREPLTITMPPPPPATSSPSAPASAAGPQAPAREPLPTTMPPPPTPSAQSAPSSSAAPQAPAREPLTITMPPPPTTSSQSAPPPTGAPQAPAPAATTNASPAPPPVNPPR
jgi:L,D-transpeptidase ErfK/SrfK